MDRSAPAPWNIYEERRPDQIGRDFVGPPAIRLRLLYLVEKIDGQEPDPSQPATPWRSIPTSTGINQ